MKFSRFFERMTELRTELFHHSKASSHQNLPPTTQGFVPHIKRAHFNAYLVMNSIKFYTDPGFNITLDPCKCGFVLKDGQILPESSWKVLDEQWTIVCKCAKCARATCPRRRSSLKCVKFCHCQKQSGQFKNPNN